MATNLGNMAINNRLEAAVIDHPTWYNGYRSGLANAESCAAEELRYILKKYGRI